MLAGNHRSLDHHFASPIVLRCRKKTREGTTSLFRPRILLTLAPMLNAAKAPCKKSGQVGPLLAPLISAATIATKPLSMMERKTCNPCLMPANTSSTAKNGRGSCSRQSRVSTSVFSSHRFKASFFGTLHMLKPCLFVQHVPASRTGQVSNPLSALTWPPG